MDKIDGQKLVTYLSTAQDLIDENPDFYDEKQKEGVLSFAKYLDSSRVLGNELHIIALQQVNKIDRELITECINTFGRERVTALARIVTNRHRHHKVLVEKLGTEE